MAKRLTPKERRALERAKARQKAARERERERARRLEEKEKKYRKAVELDRKLNNRYGNFTAEESFSRVDDLLKLIRKTERDVYDQMEVAIKNSRVLSQAQLGDLEKDLLKTLESLMQTLEEDFKNQRMKDLFREGYALGGGRGKPASKDLSSLNRLRASVGDAIQRFRVSSKGSVRTFFREALPATKSMSPKEYKQWQAQMIHAMRAAYYDTSSVNPNTGALLPSRAWGQRPVFGVVTKNGKVTPISEYGKVIVSSGTTKSYNMGFLRGAESAGHKKVLCRDGIDCGWKNHRSSDKANGKIITIQDARRNTASHPNCRRRFVLLTDGSRAAQAERASLKIKIIKGSATLAGVAVALKLGSSINLVKRLDQFEKLIADRDFIELIADVAYGLAL